MADFPIQIAEWRRNHHETIRLQLDSYRDRPIVDLRTWWPDDAGEMRPSRKGITLSVKHLPALADAVNAALEKARDLGLFDEGGK